MMQGKEQPDKKPRLFAGATRKTDRFVSYAKGPKKLNIAFAPLEKL